MLDRATDRSRAAACPFASGPSEEEHVVEPIDPTATFVHLLPDGGAEPIPATPGFWRDSATDRGLHRLIGAVDFLRGSDLHEHVLERHPGGDEVLLLASGELEVVVDGDDGGRRVVLHAGEACIVPRGAWHCLRMRRPGRLITINHRAGMETRPARDVGSGRRTANPDHERSPR